MQPRVHILEVPGSLQPESQPFRYPAHNRDWGVEQDFLAYLNRHPERTAPANVADWHYLPVFWTRWHLNHDYATRGVEELAGLVHSSIRDDARTFTVCQYDDGPVVEVGRTTLLLASRRDEHGIDIPLLSEAHRRPRIVGRKRWLASFVGRLSTHAVRGQLATALADRSDVRILDGDYGTRRFVRTTVASRVALCPRGYGGSSFRFFEAAQLGTAPMLVGDLDTRPFPDLLDWDECSLYAADADEAAALLDVVSPLGVEDLGRRAATVWRDSLTWCRWCPLALRQLAERT